MADQRVRTTTTDWKTECARVDAQDALDTAQAGITALEQGQPYDRAYEFSNGRKFKDGRKPSA